MLQIWAAQKPFSSFSNKTLRTNIQVLINIMLSSVIDYNQPKRILETFIAVGKNVQNDFFY